MSNRCQARVQGDLSYTIGEVTFYQGTRCKSPAIKKVVMDDGDAFFYACDSCLKNYLYKKPSWWGLYDCSSPPLAPVIESNRYFECLFDAYKEEHPDAKREFTTPGMLRRWLQEKAEDEKEEDSLTGQGQLAHRPSAEPNSSAEGEEDLEITKTLQATSITPLSEVEQIQKRIDEINIWFNGVGKTLFKEQPKMLTERIKLKAKLISLEKTKKKK